MRGRGGGFVFFFLFFLEVEIRVLSMSVYTFSNFLTLITMNPSYMERPSKVTNNCTRMK